jgi:hypothetical protein
VKAFHCVHVAFRIQGAAPPITPFIVRAPPIAAPAPFVAQSIALHGLLGKCQMVMASAEAIHRSTQEFERMDKKP